MKEGRIRKREMFMLIDEINIDYSYLFKEDQIVLTLSFLSFPSFIII